MPKKNQIIVKCEQCNSELFRCPSLISPRNFCNMKCLGLYRRNHPTTDASQMHTPEVHEKIRWARRADPPKGEKNGMFGRKHSEETRAKMSEAKTRLIVEGKFKPYGTQNKKGTHVSTKTGTSMYFKSSWEEEAMKHLDTNPDVVSYEYEKLRISYSYNNHKRWYVPDFVVVYVDGHREMWEVKPEQFLKTERVSRTIEAGRVYCAQNNMSYLILTRQVLKEKGIMP